jgi:hypothetical protein
MRAVASAAQQVELTEFMGGLGVKRHALVALVAWHWTVTYSAYTVQLVLLKRVLWANDTPPKEFRAAYKALHSPGTQTAFANKRFINLKYIRQCPSTLEVPRADWATLL